MSNAFGGIVTRFAPSPTGPLHLGHAYSAVRVAALVRPPAPRGRLILRIDDIDAGRCRADFVAGLHADLAWLGIAPDLVVPQSARRAAHDAGLARLRQAGLAYPCGCTRAAIAAAAAASAPHGKPGGAGAPVYPGTCAKLTPGAQAELLASGRPVAWRLRMAAALALAPQGDANDAAAAAHGDIVLARKDAGTSYHLSSVIDDADLGVTHVVRGDDLAASAPLHALLHRLLGTRPPIYRHHRLVAEADGGRLAKRDGAAPLAALRAAGWDGPALARRLAADDLPDGLRLLDFG